MARSKSNNVQINGLARGSSQNDLEIIKGFYDEGF